MSKEKPLLNVYTLLQNIQPLEKYLIWYTKAKLGPNLIEIIGLDSFDWVKWSQET